MKMNRLAIMLALVGTIAPVALAQNTDPAKQAQDKARQKADEAVKKAQDDAKKALEKHAQPGDATQQAMDPNDPMMKAWMEAATPGEHHTYLAQLAGEWEGTNTWRMDPNAPWNTSSASCSSRMIMDGRYLHSEHRGDMMGMAFYGMGTWGYNNTTKQYESSWIDNCGTMTMLLTGSCSEDGKTFKLNTKYVDPMTGKDTFMKQTCSITSPDSYKMEFYSPDQSGKEFKSMEIDYKRVGNAAPASAPTAKPAGH